MARKRSITPDFRPKGAEKHLEIVYKPVDWFKPYERNPRKNDDAVDRMCASIKEFGFTVPMLARSTGEVVDGHLRLKSVIKMGELAELPAIMCDGWTEAQVRAFRLLVNRSVAWAQWDMEALAAEFADLKTMDFDLGATGFDSREIDALTLQANPAEDEVPPVPENPVTRPGDLWLMGGHRLLCGDCTDAGDFGRLMDGKVADLALTDPPYGIGIVKLRGAMGVVGGGVSAGAMYPYGGIGGSKPYGSRKNGIGGDHLVKARLYAPVVGDEKPFDPKPILQMAKEQIIFGANFFASRLPDGKAWITWDKDISGTFSACELAWTSRQGRLRMYRHMWSGLRREGPRNEELRERVHPTQKPVGLFREILRDFTEKGVLILDPYLGSGTTLIAAELTERLCFSLEIETAYCDVIVTRWQNLTGKQATLDGIGATFEQVRAGRLLEAQDAIKEEAFSG